MKKSKATANQETISDFAVEMMNDEENGEEFTREYLKSKFLSSVGRSLYYARERAGLTQEQVAERMNTKQPAIARLEASLDGSMSFRRYVDFVIACGMMPRSLMLESILEPIDTLRDEMVTRALIQRIQEADSEGFHTASVPQSFPLPDIVQAITVQSETSRFSLDTQRPFNQKKDTPTADSAALWLQKTSRSQSTA